MQSYNALSLKVVDDRVLILDQTRLPDEALWLDGSHPEVMIEHIKALRVRGAPLIGIAAGFSLAWAAQRGTSPDQLRAIALALRESRPTAVNLMQTIDRMLAALERDGRDALIVEAGIIFNEDADLCASMAAHGAALIQDGEGILTHCNTGGLATAGVGTALGVIREAWRQGKRIHVFVDETRPLLQGGRLTAWELVQHGIPHTLITDSMAALVMRQGRVQRVLVGADRIARNGDFANKVGTYGLAVAAGYHKVPIHPVAPRSTVDLTCPDGNQVPIEERSAEEVRGVRGSFGAVRWAPVASPVFNPAFDVTPVSLVTSLVLDSGVLSRDQLERGELPAHLGETA